MFAKNHQNQEVDPPMEIQVLVQDENDNEPVCKNEETVLEVQENEPPGKSELLVARMDMRELFLFISCVLLLFGFAVETCREKLCFCSVVVKSLASISLMLG